MLKLSILLLILVGVACSPAATSTPAPTATIEMIGDTTPIVPIATLTTPFDALFIDSMTRLHQNILDLAQAGLTQGEHEEVRTFAQGIVDAQGTQMQQLSAWRAAWYPDEPPTNGIPSNLTTVELAANTDMPFDLRFINAVIDHHRMSIAIAQVGQTQAEHEELRTLAEQIFAAQDAAITQLEAWRQAWFEVSG